MTRAPTRIDLGGGWTDVPPYCEREGGFVCNVAIARYASVSLSHQADNGDQPALVRAALRRSGARVRVDLRNDFPLGAGLGGSSAASAALLVALAEWQGEKWDRAAVAELGRTIEVEDLGVAGGRQDHYAATHGGALALTFTSTTSVKWIPLGRATREAFLERALLLHSGESRISSDTITAVMGAYERREPRVTRALERMKALAQSMATALERGDLDALREQLAEHWIHQRSLHPTIPTERIDRIVTRAGAMGAAAKAMGASGGGCVLIIARDGESMKRLRLAMAGLGDPLDFTFDDHGVRVIERAP